MMKDAVSGMQWFQKSQDERSNMIGWCGKMVWISYRNAMFPCLSEPTKRADHVGIAKWATCIIYAQQNKQNQKVTTERWQYWHDQLMINGVFLSVLQWTNMQMFQRYFMFHPITQCHSLGHVITSTIPLTFEREGFQIQLNLSSLQSCEDQDVWNM